jgi:hypothetical protein
MKEKCQPYNQEGLMSILQNNKSQKKKKNSSSEKLDQTLSLRRGDKPYY